MYEKRMKLYMEKLGMSASPSSISDGGRVLMELNQLNQRYMRLVTELHQRLTHIKRVYDDAGIYFPVSCIHTFSIYINTFIKCLTVPGLQCFDAVGWMSRRASSP